MSGPDDPILLALAPWLDPEAGCGVLLAVSGGPDSSALMHAAAAFRTAGPIHVATVDHGLRPGSAAEAEGVARAARALGLAHAILPWRGEKPATGVQDAARRARYALLAAHAKEIGAGLVLTGHTRDDQAETVLLRLCAGSGPAGLAGMAPDRALAPGIRLGRPFLGLPKDALAAWCAGRGAAHAEDPSNADPRFARVRLRAAWPALEREGLTHARLARLAGRLARDEAALRALAERALNAASLPGDGAVRLAGAALTRLPEAVALRCVGSAVTRAGGAPPRLERLETLVLGALLPALRRGEAVRRTLAGLLIAVDAAGIVTLAPAPPRRSPPRSADLAAGGTALLGKGETPAYIGRACTDGPATPSAESITGRHAPGIDR